MPYSRNCPGFDTSILRHGAIWGAADEAVLNIVHKKRKKNPKKSLIWHVCRYWIIYRYKAGRSQSVQAKTMNGKSGVCSAHKEDFKGLSHENNKKRKFFFLHQVSCYLTVALLKLFTTYYRCRHYTTDFLTQNMQNKVTKIFLNVHVCTLSAFISQRSWKETTSGWLYIYGFYNKTFWILFSKTGIWISGNKLTASFSFTVQPAFFFISTALSRVQAWRRWF